MGNEGDNSPFYIEENGCPLRVTFEEYSEYFNGDRSLHRVALTAVGTKGYLSTVFLGIDQGFIPGGEPILYETKFFPKGPDGLFDNLQERYHTREEALIGHNRILKEMGFVAEEHDD